MSLVLNDSTDLTSLGDAIRTKTGDSNLMTVAEMATAVNGIETGSGAFTIKQMRSKVITSRTSGTTKEYDLSPYLTYSNQIWFAAVYFTPNSNDIKQGLISPLFNFYYTTSIRGTDIGKDDSGNRYQNIPIAYCDQYTFNGTATKSGSPNNNSVYGDSTNGVFNISPNKNFAFNYYSNILAGPGSNDIVLYYIKSLV